VLATDEVAFAFEKVTHHAAARVSLFAVKEPGFFGVMEPVFW
jgi:hypothetical protein